MDNKIIYTILGIAVIALIISCIALVRVPSQVFGGRSVNSFSGLMRNTSSSMTTTAREVSTSTTRSWLLLVNDGSNTVYCHKASTSTTLTAEEGIRLNASGGSYEINGENLYQGTVSCLTNSGTSSLTLSEKW